MSHNHKNRNDLSEEHAFTDIGQIVCLFVFLTVWVLDSFVFRFVIIPLPLPVYITILIAIPFFLLSLYLAITSHKIVFKEVREPPSVITKSVFNWIRHPMYLSEILIYSGLCIITLSGLSLIILILIVIFFNHVASYEEKKLEEKFGEEYEKYKKKVGKWIPGLPGSSKIE
ncbi:MAG: isoprenylcysteine carboxylmethyltransferase family protein [Spirochaetales bacterium]|nr:isoprenylcysteine carboxylmethyltransferase family protein [Spirochaetales bacterium]